MLLYAWIAWNLIGGIVSGTYLAKRIKKNEKAGELFMNTCNDALEYARNNEYITAGILFSYARIRTPNGDYCRDVLKFLEKQGFLYRRPSNKYRFYLVKSRA